MRSFSKFFFTIALMGATCASTLAQNMSAAPLEPVANADTGRAATESSGSGAGTNSNAGLITEGTPRSGGTGANESNNINASEASRAGAEGTLNYNSIISGIRSSSTTAAQLQALGSAVKVSVVTLSELRGRAGGNLSSLEQAISTQRPAITELQTAIVANNNIRTVLQGAGYEPSQVIAVAASADGQVSLVVDDSKRAQVRN